MTSLPTSGRVLAPWRHRVTQEASTTWTRLLDDPNPIHHDAALVQSLGLGERPINPGPANLAYFYNMLATCFPDGETRSLQARLTGNVYVGDWVEVTGHVVSTDPAGERTIVHCALSLRGGEDRPPAAVATAEVVVPTRSGGGT